MGHLRRSLWPLSKLFGLGVSLKNWSIESGKISVKKARIPVVSVGNITMGGTGKTPVLCELLEWAVKNNINVGVVSRGYGRAGTENEEVKWGQPEMAIRYGDEPTMIKNRFPSVPIFVGADRFKSIELMCASHPVQIVFADDAFQHRQLHRDLDILILDGMEDDANYELLPLGRAREPLVALKRAEVIILSRCNLVSKDRVQSLVGKVRRLSQSKALILELEYHAKTMRPLAGGSSQPINTGESSLLVSAVGRPDSIEKTLPDLLIRDHLIFKDHHIFTKADVMAILKRYVELGSPQILITEKDAVKLEAFSELHGKCWIIELRPQFNGDLADFYARLNDLLI
jgi:tetraacyldisaccharide 4'-kinase